MFLAIAGFIQLPHRVVDIDMSADLGSPGMSSADQEKAVIKKHSAKAKKPKKPKQPKKTKISDHGGGSGEMSSADLISPETMSAEPRTAPPRFPVEIQRNTAHSDKNGHRHKLLMIFTMIFEF